MRHLQGKRIVMTGGSQGIGAACVRAFTAAGASVASLDVQDSAETAQSLAPGAVAHFLRCDVSQRTDVDQAVDAAVDALGGLDVLVNVAGVQRRRRAEEFTDEDLDFLIGINLRGTILTNQAAFRHLREAGGSIINFGSDGGLVGMAEIAAYGATKGGVMSWTRHIAYEWGQFGIRANSVVPAMKTPMTDNSGEQGAKTSATIPLGGAYGDVDRDFAPVMVFLASDDSRYITGQLISVNGGLVMTR